MQLLFPGDDLNEIELMMNLLANGGRTTGIRYKAYLASMIFQSRRLFDDLADRDYENGDQFFVVVANRLQQTLLGSDFR